MTEEERGKLEEALVENAVEIVILKRVRIYIEEFQARNDARLRNCSKVHSTSQ